MNIEQEIRGIVQDELNLHKLEVISDVSLRKLGADSLDMVEIVMRVEEQFGLEIPDEDAEDFETIRDIVDYVDRELR